MQARRAWSRSPPRGKAYQRQDRGNLAENHEGANLWDHRYSLARTCQASYALASTKDLESSWTNEHERRGYEVTPNLFDDTSQTWIHWIRNSGKLKHTAQGQKIPPPFWIDEFVTNLNQFRITTLNQIWTTKWHSTDGGFWVSKMENRTRTLNRAQGVYETISPYIGIFVNVLPRGGASPRAIYVYMQLYSMRWL